MVAKGGKRGVLATGTPSPPWPAKLLPALSSPAPLRLHIRQHAIIAEFPTFEAAKTWYDSPAYRELRKHRQKGAIFILYSRDASMLPQFTLSQNPES
jgi:Domain of unknown function (DUF1330)